jgi:hypothetical protein
MPTFLAELDHLTGIRIGAMATFQVISLRDEDGIDRTKWLDPGAHYSTLEEVAADIARVLKVPESQVQVIEG